MRFRVSGEPDRRRRPTDEGQTGNDGYGLSQRTPALRPLTDEAGRRDDRDEGADDVGRRRVSHVECVRRGQQVVGARGTATVWSGIHIRFTVSTADRPSSHREGDGCTGLPAPSVRRAQPSEPVPEPRRLGGLAIGPHDAVLRRHRAWMSTSAAKEAYGLRKQLVEPVFGACCAASPTWRPSGPCWPPPSTYALSVGCGAPDSSSIYFAARRLIQFLTCSDNSGYPAIVCPTRSG